MRTNDGYIIHKCLNGKPEAFGFLVDKYRESVFAFAYSELRNFHDAEDVTQEVFIKAYRKLKTLRQYDSFHAWLYSITSHLCKDLIRSRQNRPDCEFIEDQPSEALIHPSIDSYREDMAVRMINEALDSLPQMYSQTLTLYYLGGMSIKEIAIFLGTSINAIKHRLSRARARLKGEVLGMMSETFDQQRLKAGFTFRIVEAVKHIRIQPVQPVKSVPWILSLAAGVIFGVLSLSPGMKLLDLMPAPMSSSLVGETKVLEVGEIPVDVMKISEMTVISSDIGKGKGVEPEQFNVQNSFFMDPQEGGDTWTKKADMPTPRYGLSASAVNGKIYVFGGARIEAGLAGADAGVLATVEEYDPATDKWTKKADMPTARARLATCTIDGKIYVIGGWPIHGDMDEYDPMTDKWTKKATMIDPAERFAACVLNGKIYAFGGWCGVHLSAVREYDPATDTWTKKTDLSEKVVHFTANAVNGKIYIIGAFPFVLEYDPISDKYTQKSFLPNEWWLRLSASVVKDKIYAMGGISNQGGNYVAMYDPVTDTWTRKADLPTERCFLATSAVNGKIYAIGGTPDGQGVAEGGGIPLSVVEEYDTGFMSEAVATKVRLPKNWGEIKTKD